MQRDQKVTQPVAMGQWGQPVEPGQIGNAPLIKFAQERASYQLAEEDVPLIPVACACCWCQGQADPHRRLVNGRKKGPVRGLLDGHKPGCPLLKA